MPTPFLMSTVSPLPMPTFNAKSPVPWCRRSSSPTGASARIIGFNRLYCQVTGQRPYQYAGAIAWAGPSTEQQRIIGGWIEGLTRALELRGINGIDLILPALGAVSVRCLSIPQESAAAGAQRPSHGNGGAVRRAFARGCRPLSSGGLRRPTAGNAIAPARNGPPHDPRLPGLVCPASHDDQPLRLARLVPRSAPAWHRHRRW